MKFILDVNYSKDEIKWIEKNNCEILSEIKLSKYNFKENEIPKRMLKYSGAYIAEIIDDDTGNLIWAELSKWKGVWHFNSYYGSLEMLEQSF